MDKKKIQEQRMKNYFIDSAKTIIKEEGLDNLTVKKVADSAGYASGTLYNYFSDLNTLLSYCVIEFMEECKEFLVAEAVGSKTIRARLINLTKGYAKYFINNPNVHQLIFLADLGAPPEELKEKSYNPEITKVLRETLKDCAKEEIIKQQDVIIIERLIANFITGLVLMFIKERKLMGESEVMNLIEEQIDYILNS